MRVVQLVEGAVGALQHEGVPVTGAVRATLDRCVVAERVWAGVALAGVGERREHLGVAVVHDRVGDAVWHRAA